MITLVSLLGGLGVLPEGGTAAAASRQSGAAAQLAGDTIPPIVPSDSVRSPEPAGSVPADSGTGRRVVFDISDQRVWLVTPDSDSDGTDEVLRTYLVSGSLTDNLTPGTFKVYSRSRWAVGIEDSGVMQYFVRFTRGDNAAIGFHSIPTKNGRALQSLNQLGTPQSHGCIRQALPDAQAMWTFAPVGTKVVVTA